VRPMTVARPRAWTTTFGAMYVRAYRWFWYHRLGSEGAMYLNNVAQGWLVYQLTGSALALGWVSSGRAIASLLISPWGGVISDRMDKRSLLIWTRVGMGIASLIVGLLVTSGMIRVWHLAASSLAYGILSALMMGAQQSIVSDLVNEETVMNAVSMNAVCLGITGLAFPALSGILIDRIGVAGVFYIETAVYALTVLALLQVPRVTPTAGYREPPARALAAGLRYTARDVVLQGMIIIAMARFLLSMGYNTYMPKFADEVLHFDAAGLGLLLSAPGLGALLASLGMATLRDYAHKGRLLLGVGLAMGGVLILFAMVRNVPLVFLLLIVLGACGNILRVLNQTILQTCCEARYRGRVMSLYGMTMGCGPLLSVPMGALADAYGVPAILALQGALLAAVFGALTLGRPALRRA
jgi:MFS family permease